jgi:hypothetical protein
VGLRGLRGGKLLALKDHPDDFLRGAMGTVADQDFLVELRGFEPLTSAVQSPTGKRRLLTAHAK